MKGDPKHPSRWRFSFLVAKTYCKVSKNEVTYIKYLVEKCYKRSDELGNEVLLQLVGV